jgi:outer membrane protein assembly factor BamB
MKLNAFPLWLGLLVSSGVLAASDWPQWRGPERTGHVPAGETMVSGLASPKVLWHFDIGNGVGSPVLAGGKVFYLDNQNAKEVVHAVDAGTGAAIWSAVLDDVHKDTQSVPGPRSTPVVDGERVYAQSCRGELQCLQAADGKLIWQTNFVKDFGAIFIGERGQAQGASRHGNTGAPLVDGDHLLAQVGGVKGAGVVCFDKTTGAVIWKSQNDTPGYAAPVLANILGTRQMICFTALGVMALDPKDGTLVWRVPIKTRLGRHATTPVVVDDIVMVGSHEQGLIGIRVAKDGAGFKAELAWPAQKQSAINFSSPVAVGAYLYGLGPKADLICVEAQTGKQQWSKEGEFTTRSTHAYAGFMVMGGNILVLTDSGELILFAADPKEFHEIAKAPVCGVNWCNPAYADGKLFLRDAKELMCVQLAP